MDDSAKGKILQSKLKAFKKRRTHRLALVLSNLYANDIFDASYVRTLHKRTIMTQIRFCTEPTFYWHSGKKKTRLAQEHERKEAARWRTLFSAMFAEEP